MCAATSKILYVEARQLVELLKGNALVGQEIMAAVARDHFGRYQRLADHERLRVPDADLQQPGAGRISAM